VRTATGAGGGGAGPRAGAAEAPVAATDRALLDALVADPDALAILYDRHASLVYGLALSVLRDPSEAEDLTQAVFVSLYEHTYDPARGAFEAYLISMTRSRAIDRLRRGGRHLRLLKQWHESDAPRGDAPTTPHQATAARQLSERVKQALGDLSDREREVLELSYYRDMTQAEIAEHLGAPLGSVKSWTRRGLARLQGALKDLL